LQNQTTWTSGGSKADFNKAAEKSPENVSENYFHLEPVLIKKDDLWNIMPPSNVYPKDRNGKALWLDSDYVTVAMIRIDLAPESFPLNSSYWVITEKLTKGLATKILHLHSKQSHLRKIRMISEERNEIIEILISQIRGIMTKLGVVYRVIDNEAGELRQTWEDLIHKHNPEQPRRANIIKRLNLLLKELDGDFSRNTDLEITKKLEWYQNKLVEFCFQPEENEVWLREKISPLWESTASRLKSTSDIQKIVNNLLDELEQSFYIGLDETLVENIDNISTSNKSKWIDLAYKAKDLKRSDLLQEYIHLLKQTNIDLPIKRKTIDNLLCLRSLAFYIEDLESKLNEYFNKYYTYVEEEKVHLH
jgi:hypothetical protein